MIRTGPATVLSVVLATPLIVLLILVTVDYEPSFVRRLSGQTAR